jgi:REP element-mobilizing transposase RayT
MKREMVVLNSQQRSCVEDALKETCELRHWSLLASNVRTNHAHTVVSIGMKKPEIALNAFKANATRKMRESGCWTSGSSPWADKGSKRYLWNEASVERAIEYVLFGQGDELPDFD